jgi:hypothetical protein
MSVYVETMRPAVEVLVGEIDRVASEIERLRQEAQARRQSAEQNESYAADAYRNPDLDDEGLGRLAQTMAMDERWEAKQLDEQAKGLEAGLAARQEAESALACALLQIAKQGISLAHGGRANCPPGRDISGISLRDIVWQGRNQAMHFDEGGLTQPVLAVCKQLEAAGHKPFADPHVKSLAVEVVKVLGWTSWTKIEADLKSLEV